MFDLEEELRKLPQKPGVYFMHDKEDEIIYIGKAINLKNRVRQYFQSSRNLMPKIVKMVSQIAYFEYIITDTELEALVLECNLIKEHRPKYNTMLKDDKGYPYIKITTYEEFPRVLFARERKKDNAKYFGPYTNGGAIKDILELLQKIYFIRTCNRNLPKDIGKKRPCLNYHIHQCKAPCQNFISKEEYQTLIHQVIEFLNGEYHPVLKQLEEKMLKASSALQFEQAAQYRDLLVSVKQIAQKQKIESDEQEDRDVIAFAKAGDEAVVQVFFVRAGKLMGREHFYITGVDGDTKSNILASFIKQYYAGTPFLPRELLLQTEIEEKKIIEEWLSQKRGSKVYIKVPKKGEKEHLVQLVEKNASLVLQQDTEKIKREEQKTIGVMKKLSDLLQLPTLSRIESFDISNTSGFDSVGSMVVYENGKQKRNDYRKFKIKWVTGANDYASMYEVLKRRFSHGKEERKQLEEKNLDETMGSFTRFPDIILMDGGKGQVNIALQVLKELHLSIPVCGMVKDENHRTRGLYYNNKEIKIEKNSEVFRFITRIQDETHRFAIEYHRNLRGKTQVHSILDEITGVGSTRRKALMRQFQSIDAIQKATIEQLQEVPSINKDVAQEIYSFFRKENTTEKEK